MTAQELALSTLAAYHAAGIETFTVYGPFIWASTAGKYAVDVSAPNALELIEACYKSREGTQEGTA